MRVLVIGYFGRGSLGDDLMLEGLRHAIGAVDLDEPPGILAIPLPNPRRLSAISDIGRLLGAAARSDRVVISGGTILRDSRGLRDLRVLAFMALLTWLLAAASRHRLLLVGAGIGPLTTLPGRSLSRAVLTACSTVVVRDAGSHALCRALAPSTTDVVLGADLALLAPLGRSGAPSESHDQRRLGVALVGEPRSGVVPDPEQIATWLADRVDELAVEGVDLLSFAATDAADDFALACAVADHLGQLDVEAIAHPPGDTLDALEHCSVAVVARYHALVSAVLLSLPVICLPYEEKVDQLRRQLGIGDEATVDYWQMATGQSEPTTAIVPAAVSNEHIARLRELARETQYQLDAVLGDGHRSTPNQPRTHSIARRGRP